MTFSIRLNNLMRAAGLSNKNLAEEIHVDASRISQLRTGRRGLPKNKEIIRAIAVYGAECINSEAQRFEISEFTGNSSLRYNEDKKYLTDQIFYWLCGERPEADNLLSMITAPTQGRKENAGQQQDETISENSSQVFPHSQSGLVDNEEKRKLVRQTLRIILAEKEKTEILCCFEENPNWYLEDTVFFGELGQLLEKMQYGEKSGVQILDTESHVYESNIRWMPFYLDGSVTPYYYPRMRDKIFKCSFIILPGKVAFHSTSVGDADNASAVVFSTDPQYTVKAQQFFKQYLAMCRPALKIHRGLEKIVACYQEIGDIHTDQIRLNYSLSPETMPEEVFIPRKQDDDREKHQIDYVMTHNPIHHPQNGMNYQLTDICHLATPKEVKEGKIAMCVPWVDFVGERYYTPVEYALHLKNILRCMEENPSYSFIPIPYEAKIDESIYLQSGVKAMVTRLKNEMVVEISYPHLVEALEEYVMRKKEKGFAGINSRTGIKNLLQHYINELMPS